MPEPNPERRSERARHAILSAAMDLCLHQGFAKVTMEGIAKHAGVGKQTIYRWWPSKGAVVQEALNEQVGSETDFPDTGDIRRDLRTQMNGVARLFASDASVPYVGLIAAAQSDPELARSLLATVVEPRVRACRQRLSKAQEQGEIRQGVDLEVAVEILYGPLYYRLLLHTRPPSPAQVKAILELALHGLGL
ncbi:TetR/AcrR family transcriptional regulator [Flindersiella endophytica]